MNNDDDNGPNTYDKEFKKAGGKTNGKSGASSQNDKLNPYDKEFKKAGGRAGDDKSGRIMKHDDSEDPWLTGNTHDRQPNGLFKFEDDSSLSQGNTIDMKTRKAEAKKNKDDPTNIAEYRTS